MRHLVAMGVPRASSDLIREDRTPIENCKSLGRQAKGFTSHMAADILSKLCDKQEYGGPHLPEDCQLSLICATCAVTDRT